MHKIKSGNRRTQSAALKLPSVLFLFLMELLKGGSLSLQTVFFAFASRSRYMHVYLFHKYYCTICVCIEPRFQPWVGKIPWKRERLPTPVFWPANSLDCIVHGVAKSQTGLSKKEKKKKKNLCMQIIFFMKYIEGS